MANTITTKNSNVVGKVPTPADLGVGELAVNLADKKLYSKEPGGTVVEIGKDASIVPWDQTASYVANDLVSYQGSVYRSKGTIPSGTPWTASLWDRIGAVTVAAAAPATPKTGDLWYDDTKDGRTYVWDGTQWVDAAPASNLGISAFDATQTYALNDQVIQSGKLYVAKGAVPPGTFQPTQWNAVDDYVQKAGDTMTGQLVVPGGATGKQAPAADEVVQKAGDTMTGDLNIAPGARIIAKNGSKQFAVGPNRNVNINTDDASITPVGIHSKGASIYFVQPKTSQGPVARIYAPVPIGHPGPQANDLRYTADGLVMDFDGLYNTGNMIVCRKPVLPHPKIVFKVDANGNVFSASGTLGAISDERLKEDVADASDKLAELCQLRVVNYKLKDQQFVGKLIGFVAQEVEQIFPGLVDTDKDDNKAVKLTPMIPMLVKAVQELTTRLEALEAK
jgi:hypothetical protein